MSEENSQNQFYELARKVERLPQVQRRKELEFISNDIGSQDARNIKPEIAAFQDASTEILKIENSLSKMSGIEHEIKESNENSPSEVSGIGLKVKELNENSPKIFEFFKSQTNTFDKMHELKMKRDFCRSLMIFSTLPKEILKEVENQNYQLATKYLISMMKFFSDPKYDTPFLNSIKQQFSKDYISKLDSKTEIDMYLHIDDEKFIRRSILAIGFKLSILYFNVPEISNPSHSNNTESIRNSIIEVLNMYFSSWTETLKINLNENSKEINNQFMKAGKTLSIIDFDIQNYILKLPYLNLPKNDQNQSFNETIINDIDSISKKYYLTIYTKYVNFSQFKGYFYTKRNIFDIKLINSFKDIDQYTKNICESWGKLVPKVMSMDCIILFNGILDLKEDCIYKKDETSSFFYDLYQKFYNLSVLIRKIKDKNDLPDFSFLIKEFENYHSSFVFMPFDEKKIKMAFTAFVYFSWLFNSIKETSLIRDTISNNFSTRIVSTLASKIINDSLKGASLTEKLDTISFILKDIYPDYSQLRETTIFALMQHDIGKSEFGFNKILDLIVVQALSGITNHYLWDFKSEKQINEIKIKELTIKKWHLNLLGKNVKDIEDTRVRDAIQPYINLLNSRIIKDPKI